MQPFTKAGMTCEAYGEDCLLGAAFLSAVLSVSSTNSRTDRAFFPYINFVGQGCHPPTERQGTMIL